MPASRFRLPFRAFAAAALVLVGGRCRGAVAIVAAENFYGDLAREIGGDAVRVTSILSNPNQDPHLFTTGFATAEAVAGAEIVIYNGAGYDPWMQRLVAANPAPGRAAIEVAALVHVAPGANPHLWYRTATMDALARRLAEVLSARDPARAGSFRANLARFQASLGRVDAAIAVLSARCAGADALATEPVFGYMAAALGLRMHGLGFQNHIMNNTEPSVRETEDFEARLQARRARVLFYNSQVSDPVATRMRAIAARAGVPLVGVTETEPAGLDYAAWMLAELAATGRAVAAGAP
jgi:zinc/manganese transport system substrate-binding protein